MSDRALQTVATLDEQRRQGQADLRQAQAALLEAEAELAQMQAAVNAFRMQCRLKVGHLIDDYLALRAEKQALWTRLQLLQQAQEFGIPYDADEPFWHGREEPQLDDDLPQDAFVAEIQGRPRDQAAEKRLYRELARRFHPDTASSDIEKAYMTTMMAAVNVAYETQDLRALRDLADELDPAALSELTAINNGAIRRLREQIIKLQRRRRQAIHKLQLLRREHTTRLWQKAARLEAEGAPWWEEVRQELLSLIERRRTEIAALHTAVADLEPSAIKGQK